MIKHHTKPVLSDVLSTILPTQKQTWLLRSCLLEGEAQSQAWEKVLGTETNPEPFLKQNHQGIKRLLPLLFYSLQQSGIEIEPSALTILRVAAVHEELRTKVVRHLCREILSSLHSFRGQIMILKGVPLADMEYTNKGHRHCHDLDILIGQSDTDSVSKILKGLGMQFQPNCTNSQGESLTVHHDTGFPISLHHQLFPIPFFNGNLSAVWARSQTQIITGVRASILSPADNLLHACGLKFCHGNRESLLWACDAWLLINKHRDLDWDVVYHCATRQCMAYPLSVILGYVAEELDAPIPDSFLERLFAAASGSKLFEREVALFGARESPGGGFRGFWERAKTWKAHWAILQWMVFPTPQYVRWMTPHPHNWPLPISYILRPLSYFRRRILGLFWKPLSAKAIPKKNKTSTANSRPFIHS